MQQEIVSQKTALKTAITPAHANLVFELLSANGEKQPEFQPTQS